MANRIWTYENRCLLYKKIIEKFGPYYEWGSGSTYHPVGKKDEFMDYLTELAGMFSKIMSKEISQDAVFMQFAWATTTQEKISGTGHTSAYILNMAAAYETGFLRSREFPELLLNERENPNV